MPSCFILGDPHKILLRERILHIRLRIRNDDTGQLSRCWHVMVWDGSKSEGERKAPITGKSHGKDKESDSGVVELTREEIAYTLRDK